MGDAQSDINTVHASKYGILEAFPCSRGKANYKPKVIVFPILFSLSLDQN